MDCEDPDGSRSETGFTGQVGNLPHVARVLCPPRAILESYARGGRDPQIAEHVSRCERCAWIVAEAMETSPVFHSEVIDISPQAPWFRRCMTALKSVFRGLINK